MLDAEPCFDGRMIKSQVKVFDHFPEVSRQLEALAAEAVVVGARTGAEAASRAASSRHRTGRMQRMVATGPAATGSGYAAGFSSEAWYARFQNDGTGGRRTRQVKSSTLRRRETPSGQSRQQSYGANKGVAPLRFYQAGQKAGRAAMRSVIERGV